MAALNAEHPAPALSPQVLPVAGVRLATAASGLKYRDRDDLALLELAPGSSFACVYTTNKFCAAPVTIAQAHQAAATPRYLVINAGNANAGTGRAGEVAALAVCNSIAALGGCASEEVLPYSTGVIGEQLDAAVLTACSQSLLDRLAADNWSIAASAILTTDTRTKVHSVTTTIGESQITATGMTKGSGMIRPDMATMLAYLATDAAVDQAVLKPMLADLANDSFNCITVDGDTSTNDAFALVATGKAGNAPIETVDDPRYPALYAALKRLAVALAQDIIRDGEGATKFVTIEVTGAASNRDCRQVADTVAHSPLVKTALFASDPNWGRILAAVGRSGIESLNLDRVDIHIGDAAIVESGEPAASYDEQRVAAIMREADVDIRISLGSLATKATVWTCDLSYDYVKINAEYRS